jgi:hypothetical protein
MSTVARKGETGKERTVGDDTVETRALVSEAVLSSAELTEVALEVEVVSISEREKRENDAQRTWA